MISGTITGHRATIRLVLRSSAGPEQEVDALVDTGFWGFLTLPPAVVASLSYPFASTQRIDFADGRTEFVPVHDGTILWHGAELAVHVLVVRGEPLLGMSLLNGSDFHMHVTEGGALSITPFPDVS